MGFFERWGGVVVMVSVVYLVKYSSLAFEFKNTILKYFLVQCAYMGWLEFWVNVLVRLGRSH